MKMRKILLFLFAINNLSAQTINAGETAVLSSDDNGNANLLLAQNITLSQIATIQNLSFYVTTAAGNLRLGIYDASGPGGGPGTKQAETNSFVPVAGWNTANVITPVSLSAGTYWIAYLPSDNNLAFKKAVTAGTSGVYYNYAFGVLPATFSTSPSPTTSHWSFYATLSANADTSKHPTVITAASCSMADIQAAINTSVNGDTIIVKGGSCTWASGTVTISSAHQIVLDGGSNTTINFNGAYFDITAGAITNTVITGFTFTGSYTNGDSPIWFNTSTSPYNLPFRFCHNTLNGGNPSAPGTLVSVTGNGPGVIDHNAFSCSNGADEMIHATGNGANDSSGWTDVVIPGGPDMIFIEDNTFNESGVIASAFQSYYGARTVARHNTFTNSQIDQHGSGGIGARWWEFYDNAATDGGNFCIRAGSGLIFSNTNIGGTHMIQEYGSYPALYQVGRGQHQELYPAYVWNNAGMDVLLNSTSGCALGEANMVEFNRDVYQPSAGLYSSIPATCAVNQAYFATDQNTLYKCMSTNTWTKFYTPYCYPHPLVSGSNCNIGITTGNKTITDFHDFITVYPNPAHDKICFESSPAIGQVNALIYAVDGKLMVQKKLNVETLSSIDVSSFSTGIYFVQLTNSTGEIIITKKVAVINN